MKKKLKSLLTILICFVILFANTTFSFADINQLDRFLQAQARTVYANIAGSGEYLNTAGNVPHGGVTSKYGYVMYVIDAYGSPQTDSVFVYNANYAALNSSITKELKTRYGSMNTSREYTNSYGIPAPVIIGDTSYSNYEALAAWLTNSELANSKTLIQAFWPAKTDILDAWNNKEEKYYLILEPVYWHGLYRKETLSVGASVPYKNFEDEMIKKVQDALIRSSGPGFNWLQYVSGYMVDPIYDCTYSDLMRLIQEKYNELQLASEAGGTVYTLIGDYCGTVYNGALYETANPNCFSGVYSLRHGVYCFGERYDRNLGTVSAPAGNKIYGISNSEIINSGYGICAFASSGDGAGPMIPAGPGAPAYVPNSLYETKFYDHTMTYDLSEAIPSSEYVTNEINVSSFIGDGGFIKTSEAIKKTHSGSTTSYYWEEHQYYHDINYDWIETDTKSDLTPAEADYWATQGYTIVGDSAAKSWWHYGITQRSDQDVWPYRTFIHNINVETYTFDCSLNYLYISEAPHIYTFENTVITNGASGSLLYDKTNSTVPSEVKGVMVNLRLFRSLALLLKIGLLIRRFVRGIYLKSAKS